MSSINTPDFTGVTGAVWQNVYEPNADSYLMLDVLEQDLPFIRLTNPTLCVEIGCGSGILSTALRSALGSSTFSLATDINVQATTCAKTVAMRNGVCLETVSMDLLQAMLPRIEGKIDLLLFNPPYVVTGPEELRSSGIEASWAGGKDGREVIDRLLPLIPSILSPNGVFYLLLLKENNPEDVESIMKNFGFGVSCLCRRRCDQELLYVYRFNR